MRRFEKKLINDLLDKLTDIHKNISSEYKAEHTESAINLLCNCQDSAVSIGNLIENREGKDSPSVKYLEKYCDSIYTIAQNIVSKTSVKKDFDEIRKHHFKIQQSIQKDIPTRLEMVFLPYQASMWGSLESIWKAAQDDPDCDAFVVPIPYFERKQDRSLGDLHYEGDRFPDYVPVTHFSNYDLRARKPDAVFFHNPYDGNNYVTMVAPDYFSTELTKHTDCLVYVPYFAFASMNNIEKNFFLMPGVLNADYVIAQSEQIRKAYMDAYEDFSGEKANKNKYLALGSPILDKVISTKREDISVPEEWNNIIAGKKVILYNTSIKGILDHKEKALEKIEDVFRTFQKQKNVVLLWRPHPLIPATIGSMLPHLLGKYQELVKQFKDNNWGIYDDTSDNSRSIAISDAYYGDGGSLLIAYGITGKPVMIQNYAIQKHVIPDTVNYTAGFECFVESEDAYWASAYHFNGLFKIDKKTMEPQYIGSFPDEDIDQKRLFSFAVKIEDDIYFCPYLAKSIAKYSITKEKFSNIELPAFFYNKIKPEYQRYKFYQCASYNNVIFFFGLQYPGIIYYDIAKGMFGTINVDNEIETNSTPFFGQIHNYGKYVVAMLHNQNKIFTVDMEHKNVKVNSISESELGFNGICFDGKNYWLTPRGNGNLICWNRDSEKVIESIPLPLSNHEGSDNINRFAMPVFYRNAIWLFPYSYNEVIYFDCNSNEIRIEKAFSKALLGKAEKSGKVKLAWSDGQYIYIFSENHPFLIKYSSDTCVKSIDLSLKEDDTKLIINKNICLKFIKSSDTFLFENNPSALFDYLTFIMSDDDDKTRATKIRKNLINSDGSAGENIYQFIKGHIH